MNRKLAILASVALVLTILGATVAGTIMAQKGQFAHIMAQGSEDGEVVAIVNGKNVTRADINKPAEFHQSIDPSHTRDSAIQLVIVPVIDDFLISVEVERRGITPTDEEARAYMQPHKEACLGLNGQDCRDYITSLGLTVDDYWANALPEYKDAVGNIKLFQAVFDERAPDDVDHEQLLATEKFYRVELRNSATITWNDPDLQRLYEQALQAE